VDEPSKIITDFWNTLNSDKVNETILVDSDVEVVLPVPNTNSLAKNATVKLNKTQIAIVKAIINNNHVTYNLTGGAVPCQILYPDHY